MKTIAPSYYGGFSCIAEKCRHTCCRGWEIDIDDERLDEYLANPLTAAHIELKPAAHFVLGEDERCPFLDGRGLCGLITGYGEDYLCQICRDHPRFRNFWSDRVEIGLGLVCEEAGRIILGSELPMELKVIDDDGIAEVQDCSERELISLRDSMLHSICETGPRARLYEYLVYRHLADALYDGRLDGRIRFVDESFREITEKWDATDGSLSSFVEIARAWSYDVEYDEDELEKRISSYT